MREIEIKVRVKDEKLVRAKLNDLDIKLSAPVVQHDVVYGKPGAVENAFDANWLRIRTENDEKVILTLKRSVVGHLDSIEHETSVGDGAELEEIIKLLGFELYSDLTKTRQKAKYKDIEICLDKIDGLGTFVEAEKMMAHDADHEEVTEELWALLQRIGLSNIDEEKQGYDVMERNQRLGKTRKPSVV